MGSEEYSLASSLFPRPYKFLKLSRLAPKRWEYPS